MFINTKNLRSGHIAEFKKLTNELEENFLKTMKTWCTKNIPTRSNCPKTRAQNQDRLPYKQLKVVEKELDPMLRITLIRDRTVHRHLK